MSSSESRSLPALCPQCGSNEFVYSSAGMDACYDCGEIIEQEDRTTSPYLFVCPHCGHEGSIVEQLGKEWCPSCGLDPSYLDITIEAVAHLWHQNSGIQKQMYSHPRLFRREADLGMFVRTNCGPHCSTADLCPQGARDLFKCFREYKGRTDDTCASDDDSMGKRSKKAKKKRQEEYRRTTKAREYATIMCAKAGWFETIIHGNTDHTKQPRDSGS